MPEDVPEHGTGRSTVPHLQVAILLYAGIAYFAVAGISFPVLPRLVEEEAGGVFSTPELRKTGMSIGEIEARHVTVINIALGYAPVPLPFMPTRLAIDPKGYVTN